MIDAAGPEAALPGSYGQPPAGFRLPPAMRLGSVRLQVSDLQRSMDWYTRVLGLLVRAQSATTADLAVPGTEDPLVILEHRPGTRPVRPGSRLGLYHVAILLPDRRALGQFVRHLAQRGLRAGASDHLVSEALYLHDPDGLGIEVYADRPAATWQRQGRELLMASDPLDLAAVVASAEGAVWAGAPAGTTIGHVHLHVGELEGADRFYHHAIGFDRMVWQYPGALFLAAGGYHHHLGTNTWAGGAPLAGEHDARLLAWTMVLPTAADVSALAASVQGKGFGVSWAACPPHGRTLSLTDPWGTGLQVTSAA